jgi:hypothetical protein
MSATAAQYPLNRSRAQRVLRGVSSPGRVLKEENMRSLALVLKLVAPIFFLVGALHLALGLEADALLGAKVSAEAMTDPALDSQNRFYGVAFTLYGVLLSLCSTNVRKYATILRCILWVFFAAGLARLVSIAIHGLPPPLILALLAGELLPPPLLVWWLSHVEKEN